MKKAILGFGTLLVAVGLLAGGLIMWAGSAAAGTTTFNSVTLSSAVASGSTTAAVSFKTASTGTIATIDIGLPQFSGGSPTVGSVSGIGAGTVASSGSGASYKVTYTVSSPASVPSGTTIAFTLGALTNPSSTGNQAVTITTKTSVPATIDTGSTLVSIVANAATTVTANVAQALTSSISGGGTVTLNVDPSTPGSGDSAVSSGYSVSVASNAKNGVTTTVKIVQALTGTAYNSTTINAVSGTFASPTSSTGKPTLNTWGMNVDGSSNTWAGPTTSGESISGLSYSGPTNSLSQTHKVGLYVDYTVPADTYTTTIYYIFTPNF